MKEKDIKNLLADLGAAARKELLDSLVVHLLDGLNQDLRQDLLRTVAAGQKESRQLSSMVEH